MPTTNLSFGNVVSTPTPKGWSQAYIAGGFFVAFSLSLEEEQDSIHLHIVGKQCLNDLEAELFTLEEKNLANIKNALQNVLDQVIKDIAVSASIGFVKDDILYVLLYGAGSIYLLRGQEFAPLLSREDTSLPLEAASGTLQNNDVFILQTKQFTNIVSEETVKNALLNQSVEEATEALTPLIHGVTEGSAAAIFVSFTKEVAMHEEREIPDTQEETFTDTTNQQEETVDASQATTVPPLPIAEKTEELSMQEIPPSEKNKTEKTKHSLRSLLSTLPIPRTRLSHKRKVILSIAIILIIVLVGSIIIKKTDESHKATSALFTKMYEPARKHFEDGQGLITLNAPLAREELIQAQTLLNEAKGKFPFNSQEEKKRLALLADVEKSLAGVSGVKSLSLSIVSDEKSPMLSTLKNSSGLYATQDDKNIYVIDAKTIGAKGKDDKSQKTLVTNNDDWGQIAGLGVFGGNIYVMDKKNGILKFSESGNEYSKSNYFKGEKPDVTNVIDIAIDSSIYILKSDGTILKYTKGVPDAFKLSGLDKPFSNPLRISTSEDMNSLYILDRGNSRIVKLGKDGAYQAQYQSGNLSKAQAFEIAEKDKKAYVLVDKKIYEMSID